MNESGTFEIGGELTVKRLGYGGMSLAGENNMGWPDDPDHARRVLERAVELGVNFVDTADMYGNGASECIIGDVIGGDHPDIVVATKGGIRKQAGDYGKVYTGRPIHIRNAVQRSAVRLQTETIDLYQYHRPSIDTPFETTVETLAELKDDGIIRHVGLSNVTVDQLETAREIVEVATVQNRYNVVDREHDDVLEACEDAGVGFIAYSPLNKGRYGSLTSELDEVAANHDATRQQVALAWLLQRSPVVLPIPGTLNLEHLEENLAATQIELTDQEMEKRSG
jgi:aryl-alcohol dehydrogenase-like predicted oxidoreductase